LRQQFDTIVLSFRNPGFSVFGATDRGP
jgi:hypothetical protein